MVIFKEVDYQYNSRNTDNSSKMMELLEKMLWKENTLWKDNNELEGKFMT